MDQNLTPETTQSKTYTYAPEARAKFPVAGIFFSKDSSHLGKKLEDLDLIARRNLLQAIVRKFSDGGKRLFRTLYLSHKTLELERNEGHVSDGLLLLFSCSTMFNVKKTFEFSFNGWMLELSWLRGGGNSQLPDQMRLWKSFCPLYDVWNYNFKELQEDNREKKDERNQEDRKCDEDDQQDFARGNVPIEEDERDQICFLFSYATTETSSQNQPQKADKSSSSKKGITDAGFLLHSKVSFPKMDPPNSEISPATKLIVSNLLQFKIDALIAEHEDLVNSLISLDQDVENFNKAVKMLENRLFGK